MVAVVENGTALTETQTARLICGGGRVSYGEVMVELWVVRIERRRDDDETRARCGRGGDGVALSPPRLAR